jgi:ATP-dependent protease Clp ATPase subunit
MSPVTERSVIAACSFCQKPNTEVTTLVAGPGVFICDGCVTLCAQVIEGKPASVPKLAPWEQEASAEEVLANLPRVAAAGTQVEQSLGGWVGRVW